MREVEGAIRRGDVAWLARWLEAGPCPVDVLGRLIGDSRLCHLGLTALAGRIQGEDDGAELAGLLPASLVGGPETALVLAGLYGRFGPFVRRWPSWRTGELPVPVRIGWLRAELVNDPSVVRNEVPGQLLYQAVRQVEAADAHQLGELVDELVATGDTVLQGEAVRLIREGLHLGLLSPDFAKNRLAELLEASEAGVAEAALHELAAPWAALYPVPPECLTARLSPLALEVAALHGHTRMLWETIEDAQSGLRIQAMELLAESAERDGIERLLEIAARDPLLLGRAAVACLTGMHRRGVFPDETHVAGVLRLVFANHSIALQDAATILYTCRRETLHALVGWKGHPARRIGLMIALGEQAGVDLGAGEAIAGMLTEEPVTALDGIRRLRYQEAEREVINLLPILPVRALATLEAIGGEATAEALREGLEGEIAPHLRSVRHEALGLLWHLTDGPVRAELLRRLDPLDLPARIAADLGGPDERELALLRSHLDPAEPVKALGRLAAHGSEHTVPILKDLLLRIVTELAMGEKPGDSEPVVPDEVCESLLSLGRRMHRRGKIRPACLLDAVDGLGAGKAFVADLVVELLARPGLTAGELAILLELLGRTVQKGVRPEVRGLLRHRDPHVRKHVIALLAREDVAALSVNMILLLDAPDVQTVRQALLALDRIEATWAAAKIAACLDHPNMNIKKTAAAALARAGSAAAVPKLLFWLGTHDNPGLREELIGALRAILREGFVAVVLDAAEQASDDGNRKRLVAALDRRSPQAPEPVDDDVRILVAGWDPNVALRIAARPEPPEEAELAKLRPGLADWLELASAPPTRDRVVAIARRICPAPRSPEELRLFADAGGILLDAFPSDPDGLLELLESAVPLLPPSSALALAEAVRTHPAMRIRPALTLLTRCGAVLTRADLEDSLAAARRPPQPRSGEDGARHPDRGFRVVAGRDLPDRR